jgi:hypothetical protein
MGVVIIVCFAASLLFFGSRLFANILTADGAHCVHNCIKMLRSESVDGVLHIFVNVTTVDSSLNKCRGLASLP